MVETMLKIIDDAETKLREPPMDSDDLLSTAAPLSIQKH